MQWFKKKQGNALTAIRSHHESTYIATVTQADRARPLVVQAKIEPTDMHDASALKKLVKEQQFDKHPISFLLENKDCQHIQIEKPNVPEAELKEAVRWAIKDLITTPVEDITLDLIEIPAGHNGEDKNHDFLYVMFSNNEHIADISNRLIDAKMNLQSIDTRIMAQRNIAKLLSQPEKSEAVLTFSSTGALVTFTNNGEVCNARYIEFTDERLDTSFEKISLEIQRSLDGFESNFRNMFVDKLMVAPFDLREQFCEHLREAIYIKVETFDLEDILDFAPDVEVGDLANQASFLPIIGAALRDEVAA